MSNEYKPVKIISIGGLCPSCNMNLLREEGANALSRKDNKTEICSDCGMREALEELEKFEKSLEGR